MNKVKNINPKDFFNANETSLGELISYKARRFKIPYNQRPWSWKKNNLEEVWRDVINTIEKFYTKGADGLYELMDERIGNPHFFGAFVFEIRSEEEYMVVDGQQRLTSVMMLFSIFREVIEVNAEKTSDVPLKTKLQKLSAKCNSILIVDNEEEDDSRLCVDEEFKPFFDACIVNPKDKDTREELIKSVSPFFADKKILKDINDTYLSFNELIKSFCMGFTEEETYNFINTAIITIKNNFFCLSVAVTEEAFSFEVFKCLNAKSLGLNEVDKIKNELFLLSKIQYHKTIKKHWDSIVNNTPKGDIGLFIRYRYLALKDDCARSKLYSIIKSDEISNTSPVKLVESWNKDSEIFSLISTKSGKIKNNKIEKILIEINSLNITLAWIPCFAAFKQYSEKNDEDLYRLLQLIRNISFRMMTVCKVDTGVLEPCLSRSARMITEGKKVKDIARFYRDSNTNEFFRSEFSKLNVRVAKRQFYILSKLDQYLSKGSGVVPGDHGIELTVEHILPRSFSAAKDRLSEWLFAKNDQDKHKEYLNRIGNLCLLEGEINGDVASFDYSRL